MDDSRSDLELYQAWAAGDRSAGQTLIARHLQRVLRYFTNKANSDADAEELVGDTFERIAANLGAFEGRGRFAAYMFGVAFNVLREYVVRLARRPEPLDPETMALADVLPSPTERVALKQHERLLLAALRSLPLATQIVLELHLFEEMGRAEIADLLGLPPGTVASRIRRGRTQLEQRLEAGSPTNIEDTSRTLRSWMRSVRRAAGA